MKILISGWYGFGNIGDELILASIKNRYQKIYPNAKIIGLSFNEKYTSDQLKIVCIPQFPFGIKQLLFYTINLKIFKLVYNIATCDIFVLGGGGFLSDWQPDAPKFWLNQLKLVKLITGGKVKTHVYGIGAGPFLTDLGKATTRRLLTKYADTISVRDQRSYRELVKNCLIKKTINVEIDPVANHLDIDIKSFPKYDVCLIPADHFNNEYWESSERYKRDLLIQSYVKMIHKIHEEGFKLSVVFFQKNDEDILYADLKQMVKSGSCDFIFSDKVDSVLNAVSSSKCVISFRLHGNIIAYNMKIKFLPIIYHFKTFEFLNMIDVGLDVDNSLVCGEGKNWDDIDPNPDIWSNVALKFVKSSNENFEKNL